MSEQERMFSVDDAVQAHKALREAAGTGPEMFPMEAFVGMISDEIDLLRERGKSDEEIAAVIEANSPIRVTAEELRQHYAGPEQRHPPA